MTLLAPLALLGLVSVPVIVGFYMLRLRRDERPITSTFLWQQLVRDVEANAPWQRLRRSLLLLVQLLLALLLVAVVARPVWERPAGLARDLVVVIDASASMSATDVFPDRLGAAKQAAIDALRDLPSDGRVSVIAAGASARVVANEASDPDRAARAIAAIEPTTAAGDLTDALRLAGALAARAHGAEILVVTDDAGAGPAAVALEAPVRVITVGRQRDNQAIVALAVRSDPSGLERVLFVSVANYSDAIVPRRLQVLADGVSVSARDLQLDSLSRTSVVIDDLPRGSRVVEARLTVAQDATGAPIAAPADQLPVDDAAWAVVPDDRLMRVLLVGPGNVYLQNAFSLLPNVELYGATPEEWAGTTGKSRFDLFVFDGFLPPDLPDAPILAIAPPRTSPLGTLTGSVANPVVGQASAEEPLLKNVDLSRLHVARTQRLSTPDWARVVLPSTVDLPLIYSGLRSGLPTTVIGFDLRQSDLPLQVAWPILVSNLAGELLGVGAAALDPLTPSSPIELALRPGVSGLRVTLPDGSVRELAPGATGASAVSFVETQQLGIYRVEEILAGGAEPAAEATAQPGASSAPEGPEDRPDRFAVDLFSAQESNIAPGNGSRIAALGGATSPAATEAGTARDEWWPALVLLLLLGLMAEWLLYERDGARRLWQGVRSRVRGVTPARGRH
jgi:Ca-activated chloride channel homolog